MRQDIDFLLIGSGIGGLTFALKVAEFGTVAVITKKSRQESSTNYAQGGIAAVISSEDSFESHIEDTLRVGAGLCKRRVVEQVIREGPRCIQQLIEWGVRFSVVADGSEKRLALGREGGHSHDRIVYSSDRTGAEVENALLDQVKNHPNIRIYPHHLAVDLVVLEEPSGLLRCYGAYILDVENGQVDLFSAKITLLATGGWFRTWNSCSSTRRVCTIQRRDRS